MKNKEKMSSIASVLGGTGLAPQSTKEVEVAMSAYKDVKAPVQFYFGNAARDLAHMLPNEEDEHHLSEGSLEAQMSRIEGLVDDISENQHRLNFFMRDLKRIFKA